MLGDDAALLVSMVPRADWEQRTGKTEEDGAVVTVSASPEAALTTPSAIQNRWFEGTLPA
jgi:hypothetical protein